MANDFCIRCIDNKADGEVCLRDDIKTTLKSVSSVAKKGCITCILEGKKNAMINMVLSVV